jgi:hypothetical protein
MCGNSISVSKSKYYRSTKKHEYEVISKDKIKCILCGKIIKNSQISLSRLKLSKTRSSLIIKDLCWDLSINQFINFVNNEDFIIENSDII